MGDTCSRDIQSTAKDTQAPVDYTANPAEPAMSVPAAARGPVGGGALQSQHFKHRVSTIFTQPNADVKRAQDRRFRKTKIVATLGPASWPRIKELIKAGVNVFRINFSHAIHKETVKIIADIRKCAKELDKPVAILGDLCGPKVRVGTFKNDEPIELKDGATVRLVATDEPGYPGCITTPIRAVVEGLEVGHRVLLDDGNMSMKVTKRIGKHEIECEVMNGGILKQKKGINVPDIELGVSALTDKDKVDAEFILQQKLDLIALSFVQRKQDILDLREFIDARVKFKPKTPTGHKARRIPLIIAKIEKPQALDNIESILEATDGIMVARGDLGVECALEEVPLAQKRLIAITKSKGQPVITATQMLETMVTNYRPTRAEVSDVANAVFDGTDAVMLSGESAAGKYPVKAVEMMARICLAAETDLRYQVRIPENRPNATQTNTAIADAAVMASDKANSALVVYTESGFFASRLSQRKPQRRIIAVTTNEQIARILNLYWGVYPLTIPDVHTTDEVIIEAEKAIETQDWLYDDEPFVFCSGTHESMPGLNCTLRLTNFGMAMKAVQIRAQWHKTVDAAVAQSKKAAQDQEEKKQN